MLKYKGDNKLNSKDTLLKKQQTVKILTNEKSIKALYNKKYEELLHLIAIEHKTVKDLQEEFDRRGRSKSFQTIYRKLKQLEKLGLVTRIGTRTELNKQGAFSTQTLFIKSAIFLIDGVSGSFKEWSVKRKREQNEILMELGKILSWEFNPNKWLNYEKFIEFSEETLIEIIDKSVNLLENQDRENLKQLSKKMKWYNMNSLFALWSLFLILLRDSKIAKKFEKCFQ